MLFPLEGRWRWHSIAEVGHRPSVSWLLNSVAIITNNLSIQMIEPVDYGLLLFCVWAVDQHTKRLAVIGSY
jgi:hypothetical protein